MIKVMDGNYGTASDNSQLPNHALLALAVKERRNRHKSRGKCGIVIHSTDSIARAPHVTSTSFHHPNCRTPACAP